MEEEERKLVWTSETHLLSRGLYRAQSNLHVTVCTGSSGLDQFRRVEIGSVCRGSKNRIQM